MTDSPVAWVCYYDSNEPETAVVFAATEAEARAQHADEPWNEVTRATEFDHLVNASQDDLLRAQLAAGWRFSCAQCGRWSDDDDESEDDNGDPMPEPEPVVHGGQVYCSQACLDEWFAFCGRRDALEVLVVAQANLKWPGIEVTESNGLACNREHEMVGSCSFKFPGGLGTVRWVRGETIVVVEKRDLEAWARFTGKPWVEAVA